MSQCFGDLRAVSSSRSCADAGRSTVNMPTEVQTVVAPDRSLEAQDTEPFVGPRPFEQRDTFRFFGRDREASELVSLVLSHPAVLLYAQSGAGKTSLINAQLIPRLREQEKCQVLKARVQGPAQNVD